MKTNCKIDRIWEKFNKNKNKKFKNQLIEHYYPYVHKIANQLSKHLTSAITPDELASHGVEGLYKAIDNFDQNRNVRFRTYAYRRIHGAMLDGLRKNDWVPRSVRARQSKIEKATRVIESKLGHGASQEDILSVLGIDTHKFNKSVERFKARHLVSIDSCSDHDIDDDYNKKDFNAYLVSDSDCQPESKLIRKEFLNKLIGKRCSVLERKIVYLYYYEGLTMKEISNTLKISNYKISESRISQIHHNMLKKLQTSVDVNPEYFAGVLSAIDECNDIDALF
jgi:RNA polymerase sigma factor for flagellar operon FliA